MRIAVLVIGLLLGLAMFIQAFLVNVLSDVANEEASEAAGAAGVIAALLWLVEAAFVLAFPGFSIAAFLIASVFAFSASGEFPDMSIWGTLSLVLAVMSFFGWRGKRKKEARERERERLLVEGAQAQIVLSQLQTAPVQTPCLSCGAPNQTAARFCGSCGAQLAPAAPSP